MKYFVLVLIAFVVAIQPTSANAVVANAPTPAASFSAPPVGTLLRSVIIYVVRDLTSKFVPAFVQFAPTNPELSVKQIIYTLQRVPEPNAITAVGALLQLVGVDLSSNPAVQTLSTPIAKVRINVNDIINRLLATIPIGAKTAKWSILVSVVAYFFADFATEVYVRELDYLSSNSYQP